MIKNHDVIIIRSCDNVLRNNFCSAANILGTEGKGFNIAMAGLNGGRVNIASCSLGGAQKAVLAAKDQLNVRHAFGKPLVEQQYLQYRMAELATQLVTSRVIVRHAASAIDNKDPAAAALCAMAKLHATDECFHVANGCLQMFGGYGYLKDYPGENQTQIEILKQIFQLSKLSEIFVSIQF